MGLLLIELLIIAAVICALFALLFIGFIFIIISSRKRKCRTGVDLEQVTCPRCSRPAPGARVPASFSQAMFGGWNSSSCGCVMNKWGEEMRRKKLFVYFF
ncbi:MAG: hypothetical protein JW904_15795 [Spirochaetales bacterium]|nr:hypothetical protein [Spirochaetales bacterium]